MGKGMHSFRNALGYWAIRALQMTVTCRMVNDITRSKHHQGTGGFSGRRYV